MITICFYVRKSEAEKVLGPHLIKMKLTEAAPTTAGVVKQPLGVADGGFNCVRLAILEGLSPIDYKFESRGGLYFLAVTFSDQGEQAKAKTTVYANALYFIANDLNYRWQTIKFVLPSGDINICSCERMNAKRKDGTVIKMVPVR
jgi:hypothetical protein